MKTYDQLKALIERRGVHPVFGAAGEGWGIEQNADELARFLVHMQALGVESVLEIGTGWKAGLARFLHDDLGWQVVSVDIHDYGHQYAGITFILSDGVELPVFPDKAFDLVIIDGDHSHEGVLRDDDYYRKFAAKVIAFHDIAGLRDCEGAAQYWREIAYSGDILKPGHYEIVADTPERGGIGYVVLAEQQADKPAPPPEPASKAARKPATKRTARK